MNERIQELAEHCDFYVGNEHWDKSHKEQQRLFLEKFAELIVRECAEALDKTIAPPSHPMNSIGWKLKQHFGVEE